MNVSPLDGISRISVVGPSGSGKTWLSAALQNQLHLPLYELDTIRFDHAGRAQATDRFVAAVSEVIDRDRWIVDGHYRDTRNLIWRRSQLVIWLNHPLPLVFWRLLWRGLRKKLAMRDREPGSRAQAENPPADPRPAASWSARWQRLAKTIRERKEYRSMLSALEASGVQILELRSLRESKALCQSLQTGSRQGSAAVSLELFGLPGAGKTTLTKAVEQDLDLQTRHGLAREWRRQSLARRGLIVLRAASDLALVLAAIRLAAGARLFKPESLWRLARLLSIKHWLRTRSGLLLFDQGVMQSLWSILYASNCTDPDPRLIAPLLRAHYGGTNSRIVLLEIDKAIAAKRVARRTYGRSRFDGMPEPDVDEHLTRAISLTAALLEAARASGLPVSTLDGTAPVDELAAELKDIAARHRANAT